MPTTIRMSRCAFLLCIVVVIGVGPAGATDCPDPNCSNPPHNFFHPCDLPIVVYRNAAPYACPEIDGLIQQAIDIWNVALEDKDLFVYGGELPGAIGLWECETVGPSALDLRSTVFHVSLPQAWGRSCRWVPTGSEWAAEFDLKMNLDLPCPIDTMGVDYLSTLVHELGHGLGLPHIELSGCIMRSGGGGYELCQAEIDTVEYFYGGTGSITISTPAVTPVFDVASRAWDVEVHFETYGRIRHGFGIPLATTAEVAYSPDHACSPCDYAQVIFSSEGFEHTIVLEDLAPSTDYCLRIRAASSSQETACLPEELVSISLESLPGLVLTSNAEPGTDFVATCPAGDGDELIVAVDFPDGMMSGPVPAADLALEVCAGELVYHTLPDGADGDATAANGYTTTLRTAGISGCGVEVLYVLWEGQRIGSIDVDVRSIDNSPDGWVNLVDVGRFSQANGTCEGDAGFSACFDFTGSGCVDGADQSVMTQHYGHMFDDGAGSSAPEVAGEELDTGDGRTGTRVPARLSISPNPFRSATTIQLELHREAVVSVAVYNISGQLVRNLAVGNYPPGVHLLEWDGFDRSGEEVHSGVYFVRLNAGPQQQTLKMVLVL